MGRALLVLDTPADRAKATHWVTKAPVGTRLEFKASKRTLPQNDLMWALLTEVAQQLEHAGRMYDPAQWKAIFLHAFGREVSFLPSLDQKTFLPIELSSADLSKDEMTDFIEFLLKEGAERGVIFQQHHITNTAAADHAPSGHAVVDDEDSPTSSQQDGGDSQSPTGSSPSSSISAELTDADRALFMECAAKLFDITVQKDLDGPAKRRVLEGAKNDWKIKIRAEHHQKLATIFLSADSIITGKNKDRSGAIREVAGWLECAPEEIGGAA